MRRPREILLVLALSVVALAAGLAWAGSALGGTEPSVHVPGPVPADGTPVDVRVELEAVPASGAEVKLWLGGEHWQASRTWNGSAFQRSDHYALDAQGPGTWSAWVPVRANPDSVNHDRLTGADAVHVGVRARDASGSVERLADASVREAMPTRPASVGPGRTLVASDGEATVRRTNHDPAPRVLDVPVPSSQARVCPPGACPKADALELDRVGEGFARVHNAGPSAGNLSTGVVVLDEHRCPLTGTLAPGERLAVEPEGSREAAEGPTGRGPCEGLEAKRDPALWHAGRRVDRPPDPPGWGQAVRDPVDGGWAPWRLPRGIAPTPVEPVEVEGAAVAFDTREHGLDRVLEVVEGARERLLVTTYLFTNEHVAAALEDAAARGVDVRVVLEPTPVGGRPPPTDALVDGLRAAGVNVTWFQGPIHEHGLQHAKVLVADGSVLLVLTENLTHSGLPDDGQGNLGLGIGIANERLAGRAEALFGVEGPTRSWQPAGWAPLDGRVALVTSPENAWRRDGVPAWIREAGRVDGLALRVAPDWGPRPNAWLSALVDASREHPVRVLASGHPEGAREDNRVGLAALEGPPRAGNVSTRLSDPGLGTVHAKALVGPDAALVGSTNWGLGGVLLNREVNLLVEDPRVAETLGSVFDHAWNGTREQGLRLPRAVPAPSVGTIVATLAALSVQLACRSRSPRGG